MRKFTNIVLMFLLSLLFNLSIAHAHLLKLGDANSCVFECSQTVKCPTGMINHSETICRGQISNCAEISDKTCGKNLAWVHQGALKFNLEIAEIADANGNKFSNEEAEQQLKAIFYGMPIER